MKIIIIVIIVLFPSVALSETIGIDTIFSIVPIDLISDNPPYDDVFNYFFTLEIFIGLFALWLRLVIKPLKM